MPGVHSIVENSEFAAMKCILGFIFFWIGVGMLLMLFLPTCFEVVMVIAALIGLGYYLFCKGDE